MQVNHPFETNERFRQACSKCTSAMTVQLFDRHLVGPGVAQMKALATGVLVQHENQNLLITASHVLDSPQVQRHGAYVLHDQAGFIDLGEFSFVRTHSTGDRLADDPIDIAVLYLEQPVVQALRDVGGLDFATLQIVDGGGPVVPCWHFIHGFPLGLTKPYSDQIITRVSLACFLPLAGGGGWGSDFPAAHLDLEYDRDLVARIVDSEDELSLPSPEGFSGCGIWRARIPTEGDPVDTIQIALAGIVHRFHSATSTIRATRLEVLLAMLLQAGDVHA